MPRSITHQVTSTYEKEELKGFSRSMAELQWLLLILVLLYFFIPIRAIDDTDGLILTMLGYAGFVLLFSLSQFLRPRVAPETGNGNVGNDQLHHHCSCGIPARSTVRC